MIVNSNNFIPQVYRKERGIQVFTKLIDIIFSAVKNDIDNLGDVYNPLKCPEQFLPLLGKTLNYDYNYSDTITANRRIIDAFTLLEKYRGSKTGLLMATAMSLTSMEISKDNAELFDDQDYMNALKDLEITIDNENAEIYIDYPNIYTVVRYILDYVRPVGMTVNLRSIVGQNINADAMLLYVDTENKLREYDPLVDSFVDKSFVNFSSVGDEQYKRILQGLEQRGTINLNN